MAPYFPLGYLSEQNTGAFVTFFAGGNFHARSPNPLVLLSLRKTRDYLSPIWGGLLDESKGPQRRRQYCLVQATLLRFLCRLSSVINFSKLAPRVCISKGGENSFPLYMRIGNHMISSWNK